MTEFWEHHLHVPADGEPPFVHRKDYGDTVRARALGTFDELLQATITHPAMLIYLDNAVSTARHPTRTWRGMTKPRNTCSPRSPACHQEQVPDSHDGPCQQRGVKAPSEGRTVVDTEWLVQSVNHANGMVSHLIFGPNGLDSVSDDYLRGLEPTTARTYAYRLVESHGAMRRG